MTDALDNLAADLAGKSRERKPDADADAYVATLLAFQEWCAGRDESFRRKLTRLMRECMLRTAKATAPGRILCVDTGHEYRNSREAAAKVRGSASSIRCAVAMGRPYRGQRWVRLLADGKPLEVAA